MTIRNLDYETSNVNRCVSIQGSATLRNLKFNEPFNHSAIRVENQNVVGIVEALHEVGDGGRPVYTRVPFAGQRRSTPR